MMVVEEVKRFKNKIVRKARSYQYKIAMKECRP